MVSVTFSQAFSGGLAGEGPHPGPPNKILGPILGGGDSRSICEDSGPICGDLEPMGGNLGRSEGLRANMWGLGANL